KPVAKKPAAKKPVAKKPAAKKPVAKKPARPRRAAPAPKAEAPKKKKKVVSPFKVGDKVVYPHHGAAVITKKERRVFNNSRADFFVLEVAIDQLILRVPVESAADLGVRPVISKTAARKVLAVFKTEPEEAGANWSRWYKLLTEKIQSGDIYQVAEVVRDLTFAQQTKGISPALKRMLSKARLILSSELRFVLDLSEEEAMKRLDKALPSVDSEDDDE
ncbi:MAG: CarD family transcriptional regulator, partial [Acidimicrobiia bacterium]